LRVWGFEFRVSSPPSPPAAWKRPPLRHLGLEREKVREREGERERDREKERERESERERERELSRPAA